MPITIQISGDTAYDTLRELRTFAAGMTLQQGVAVAPVAQQNVEAATAEIPAEQPEAPAAEEPKKERKPRASKKEAAPIVAAPESVETQAQDEEDEQAESEAASTEQVTHEDVRNAFGKYVRLYGLDITQIDGPKMLAEKFPGKNIVAIAQVPNTQEDLRKALNGVNEMLEQNPYKRQPVKAGA